MNSILILVIITIGLFITIYITAPLLIFFHELGHAIAFLILARSNKIDIYIGSYGNKMSKFNFKIGRLYFHISPTFSIKAGGMCSSDKMTNNYIKGIIILLAGPLFTVILSSLLGFFIFNSELHGAIKFYFFCLIICAFIGLWTDLVPRVIKEHNLYNDGKQILFIYRIRQVFSNYVLAQQHLLRGENDKCIIRLKPIITRFPDKVIPLRQLITALILTKEFEEAKTYLVKLKNFTEFMIDDYTNMGYIQILSAQHKEAEANFYMALKMNPNHPIVLNNLGYVLILLENYEDAKQHLEKVIKLSPLLAEPYNNLGQLKLLTNQLEEGKVLIEKSIVLNPENADAYKNLGDYYLKAENMELAKFNFDKASELNSDIVI